MKSLERFLLLSLGFGEDRQIHSFIQVVPFMLSVVKLPHYSSNFCSLPSGTLMLIHSSSQLLTLSGGPQRGKSLGSLGLIENGAVVLRDEKIVAVGTTAELRASYPHEPTLDASQCVLMPGLVDPHTHVIWGGDRANEFEMKMAGKPYLEILAEGAALFRQ